MSREKIEKLKRYEDNIRDLKYEAIRWKITRRTEGEAATLCSFIDYLAEKGALALGDEGMVLVPKEPILSLSADSSDNLQKIQSIIKETVDSPTYIDPAANCRNLMRLVQKIERICCEHIKT